MDSSTPGCADQVWVGRLDRIQAHLELGKGWGMNAARRNGACLFGARLQVAPDSTLGEIDAGLRELESLIQPTAAHRVHQTGGEDRP